MRRAWFALLGVVAPACAGGPSDEAQPAPSAIAVAATSTVPAALAFTAPLVGGGDLDAGTLAGRAVVFWFWSPF